MKSTHRSVLSAVCFTAVLAVTGIAYAATGEHAETPGPPGEAPPSDETAGLALLEQSAEGGVVLRLDDNEGVLVVPAAQTLSDQLRSQVCANDAPTRQTVTDQRERSASATSATSAAEVLSILDCDVVGFHMIIDGTSVNYVIGVGSEDAAKQLSQRLDALPDAKGEVVVDVADHR